MDADTKLMGSEVRFQTTRWSLVKAAQDMKALDALISIYWKPLYFFVRQKGLDNETSKDLVQGFLTRLLEHHSLLKADPSRGRFRTFLLTSLANFIKDWQKAGFRKKRSGSFQKLPIDFLKGESDYALQVNSEETPEAALNRAWAQSLWEKSLGELQATPAELKAFHLYCENQHYRHIARETGLSESSVNSVLRRLKVQLRNTVIGHIRETVSSEEELRAELAEFKSLLSGRSRAARRTA